MGSHQSTKFVFNTQLSTYRKRHTIVTNLQNSYSIHNLKLQIGIETKVTNLQNSYSIHNIISNNCLGIYVTNLQNSYSISLE